MASTKEMTAEYVTDQYLLHGEEVENAAHDMEYHVFDRFGDMSDTRGALFSGSYAAAVNYILGCYDDAEILAEITRKTGVEAF